MVGLTRAAARRTDNRQARQAAHREERGKRVLMASLDTNRPDGDRTSLPSSGSRLGRRHPADCPRTDPGSISRNAAKQQATLGGYDVYMLGHRRGGPAFSIDEELMTQVAQVRDVRHAPARRFSSSTASPGRTPSTPPRISTTASASSGGHLSTPPPPAHGRVTGAAGAALSMRAVTGKPIKFIRHRPRSPTRSKPFEPRPHRRPHSRHGRHR